MPCPAPPSPEPAEANALGRAILADAAREAEALLAEARREAAARLDQARLAATRAADLRQAAAEAEARRQSDRLLSRVPLECRRIRDARMGDLLEALREEAMKRLATRTAAERAAAALRLAAHAVRNLGADDCSLRFSEADRPELESRWEDELHTRLGPSPVRLRAGFDPSVPAGGAVAEDPAGHRRWDNTPQARLRRLWPALLPPLVRALGFASGKPHAPP